MLVLHSAPLHHCTIAPLHHCTSSSPTFLPPFSHLSPTFLHLFPPTSPAISPHISPHLSPFISGSIREVTLTLPNRITATTAAMAATPCQLQWGAGQRETTVKEFAPTTNAPVLSSTKLAKTLYPLDLIPQKRKTEIG